MRRPVVVIVVPGEGAEVQAPDSWIARAREGMATQQDLQELARQIASLEAGRNIQVTTADGGRLLIEALAGAASYVDSDEGRPLREPDNGRVIRVNGSSGVAEFVISTGLPVGFTCLLRQMGARQIRVRGEQGVTMSATPTTTNRFDEIAIEATAPNIILARLLPN